MMAVNFLLRGRRGVAPGDPLGRSWVGWDKHLSDDELWETNRGLWNMAARAVGERFATLSYDGVIEVVAEVTGRTQYEVAGGSRWALTGTVLRPGDPIHDELVGSPAPRNRNPVSYFDTAHLDRMTTVDRAEKSARRPATMLVTWNPAKWTVDDYDAEVKASAAGRLIRGRWSTGSRKSGVEPGDRVFFLLQGDGPRGIIGSGTCTSRIFSGTHWSPDRPGDDANYVLISWDTLIDAGDALTRTELINEIPDGGEWRPQSSGTLLSAGVAEQLEQRWARHLGYSVPQPPRASPRQGWQLDSVRRKKVEDAAQRRLTEHYEALGWTVRDTRYGNPYDAVATKLGDTLYLEAKGTESSGSAVIVTPNEVSWARQHPGACVLGILSDIRFGPDGEVDPGSGVFRIVDWNPDAGVLTSRVFDWSPPAEAS